MHVQRWGQPGRAYRCVGHPFMFRVCLFALDLKSAPGSTFMPYKADICKICCGLLLTKLSLLKPGIEIVFRNS